MTYSSKLKIACIVAIAGAGAIARKPHGDEREVDRLKRYGLDELLRFRNPPLPY